MKRLNLEDAIWDLDSIVHHQVCLYFIEWFSAFDRAAHQYFEDRVVAPYDP